MPSSSIFISYSRKDAPFVHKFHDALKAIDEREIWVDFQDIPPSADWLSEIYAGIEKAETFVFIISPHSAASVECGKELAHALKHNKRLIPVVRVDADSKNVPPALASLNWVFCREKDDFDRAVQTLVKVLDTDLDWVRTHTRLLVRAVEWDTKDQDPSFALRGKDLREAETWLTNTADKTPRPTPLHTQYVLAGRQEEARRARLTLLAVTAGLIISVMLGVVAVFQWRQAVLQTQIALSRQLAAQALNLIDDQIDLAMLLSLEANHISEAANAPSAEVKGSLLDALEYSPQLEKILAGHADHVRAVAVSPDGSLLASGG
ncbi:MAG: TIR domain-containing protein, partial [Chloroflexota bacterium]